MSWFRYFAGTPQRLHNTLIGLAALLAFNWLFPGAIAGQLHRLVEEVAYPLLGPAVTLALIIIAYRMILGGRS